MVCKECGAYNAEHLTHCRVCAAKLREDDILETNQETDEKMSENFRPSRRFAEAPKWPSRAYEGAKEAQPIVETKIEAADTPQPAEPETVDSPAAEPEFLFEKPLFGEGDTNMPRFCMKCGKALVPGAAFCPFCGSKVELPVVEAPSDVGETKRFEMPKQEAAESPRERHPRPVDAARRHSYDDIPPHKAPKHSKEIEDDLDEDDFEEEEDEKPVKAKSSAKAFPLFSKKKKAKDEEDDEFEDLDDLDDEDLEDLEDEEDDFDDEYYDQEFDDDELDVKPKKKGSTIILILLILLLLGLIAFFAIKIFGGGKGLSGLFGGSKETPVAEAPVVEEPVLGADDVSATIVDDEVDGVEMFRITVQAPNESLVTVVTKANLEEDTVEVTKDNQVAIRVPKAVFLPGNYCDSTTVQVTPQLSIMLPDGTTKPVDLPACTVTVPQVSLVITEPEAASVEAPADGSKIKIAGTVTDHMCKVTVNDEEVKVYEGGEFSYYYVPTDAEDQEVTIIAQKENYMTATQTIHVTPYVIKDMEIKVTEDIASLTAIEGKVTITGTVPAGTTMTAIANSPNVSLGEVTVTDTTFSCVATVSNEGVYKVTLDASCEGYNDGTAEATIECPTSIKSSLYKTKALNVNKNYAKVSEGKVTDEKLLFAGTIKEIITTTPYTIFTVADSSGNIVYVCNRSTKMQVTANKIGKKCTVAGFNNGLYPDTTSPYIWAWYIWNS